MGNEGFSSYTEEVTTAEYRNDLCGKEIIQQIIGCDWDEETNNTHGHIKYGNNGEDFIILDTKTGTWIATDPKAEVIAEEWNANKAFYEIAKNCLQNVCLPLLHLGVRYGKSYLSRKVFFSTLSLLSSCHATGFFPNKAMMCSEESGEEIHEGVEHGDLLPNDDGSFQLSVHLEVLEIPPEDWGRYECIFELSGVKNDAITKLDQDSIRSNNPKNEGLLTATSIAVIAMMGCVVIILAAALSFTAFKLMNVTNISDTDRSSTLSSETISLQESDAKCTSP
ncbi:major histocompatibility complex class I-related gene protein-like [Poeciliopsis prolifica]|uniref:major histocompatibility complex class I-related gene protein-like n=1 Tax=Poeciliopsis prolifica TaxID=188132 RepID=UPI0024131934|nr:major histocompatibility complex class I-related gene protein-like [Poeciliopsis prolifica]